MQQGAIRATIIQDNVRWHCQAESTWDMVIAKERAPEMSFLRRRQTSTPDEPQRTGPTTPGAMLFTLRSVPRHYHALQEAIESTGEATVYFGEALAYIRGKGISLFRVEATGTDFVDTLYKRWRELEWNEAFRFDITLYVHNTEYVDSLRGYTPQQAKDLIKKHAPTYSPANDEQTART
jgi:hypothetical protein